MKASEIMTRDVISVHPDAPARQIARLLLEKGISAVPVVDESGAPLGIVSEGDLIGRSESDREARRDWWLALLAEGEELNPDFVAGLQGNAHLARDIMSGPVVTVDENADVVEIAQLLRSYHIKRVPVVRNGQIVGIVSRADLLRALAEETPTPAPHNKSFLASAFAGVDERFIHRHAQTAAQSAPPPIRADDTSFNASDFRHLVEDFEHKEELQREQVRRAAAARRRERVAALIDQHMSDVNWRNLLHLARRAAENGEKEYMLLQFPSQLCSDGGRAINATAPDWPTTLRGDAAEIFLRWERDLKPHGFHLAARVLEFPGGVPGDIGLFLVWGI